MISKALQSTPACGLPRVDRPIGLLARWTALAAGVLAVFLALAVPPAAAQPADAGTLLREAPRPAVPLPSTTAPAIVKPATPAPPGASGITVRVTGFALRGATLVPEAELQDRLAPYAGRELTFSELQQAADSVAQAYQALGLLARAFLPEQDLRGGVLTIAVVEGRLSNVRIDAGGEALRLRESTIHRFMLARNAIGAPVNTHDAQRAINLLNDLPGVEASALLEPGTAESDSVIVVKARDSRHVGGFVQADNAGVRSTGLGRLTGGVSLDDPLGLGDQLSATVSLSQHSEYGRGSYTAPVGGDGTRVTLAVSALKYAYDENARFSGSAQTASLGATYPLHRDNDWNLNIGGGFDFKRFKNDIETSGVTNTLSKKRIGVATFALTGNAYDQRLGGGYNQYALSLIAGRLDLGGEATDRAADQAVNGPKRQGGYSKLSILASRLQRLSTTDTLAIALNGQLASKNLDSSEKISAGGPAAVRAYPAGEGNADDGVLLNVELQHRLAERVQVSVFYDAARIRRDHSASATTLAPNSLTLQGVGIGLSWGDPRSLSIHATVAARVGANSLPNSVSGADPSNTRNRARAWLTAVHVF